MYQLYFPRHHIAWLMVAESWRGQGIGSRLLQAAESYLYYCPVHFATDTVPLYGSVEGPRPPLFGSSQHLGVSLADDRPLIDWLARRGYGIVEAGDVSLARRLDKDILAPPEPRWAGLGLRPVTISQQQPWTGQGYDELRLWGGNGGWPYSGLVLVDAGGTAIGRVVWYPQPSQDPSGFYDQPGPPANCAVGALVFGNDSPETRRVCGAASIARLDVAEDWRGRGLGSYLLDRALHELQQAGYARVEVQTHLQKHALAFELYQRRKFLPEAAWANLVKQ